MGLVDWLLFFLELWLKYYLFKIIFLMFLNCFDVYISKINFFKKNNIILIYFQIKNVTINTITLITLAWRLNDTGYFYFGVVLSCSIFSMFIKKKIKSFFIRKKKRVWHDTLKISMPKSPFDLVFANWSWLLLLLLFLTFYFFVTMVLVLVLVLVSVQDAQYISDLFLRQIMILCYGDNYRTTTLYKGQVTIEAL